jgi:hypothetical protein
MKSIVNNYTQTQITDIRGNKKTEKDLTDVITKKLKKDLTDVISPTVVRIKSPQWTMFRVPKLTAFCKLLLTTELKRF